MTHSNMQKTISDLIIKKIRLKGPLEFSEYMDMALYHEELGYYRQDTPVQGIDGDYITSPSMDPLFAQCLVNNICEILEKNPLWTIAEIGPGKGQLACDIICELAKKNILIQYLCIEPGEKPGKLQKIFLKKNLPENLYQNISWHNSLPNNFKGIILANEILDAMACDIAFSDENRNLHSLVVDYIDKKLIFSKKPICKNISKIMSNRKIPIHNNYRYEINTNIPKWINNIYNKIDSSIIFIFDYGYSRKQYYNTLRSNGTLTCFQKHTKHNDPFLNPGKTDISIHVDFTLVAESACESGFSMLGYAPQSSFLMSSGIANIIAKRNLKLSNTQQAQLALIAKKLILPNEMGELIKVISLGKNTSFKPSCFKQIDISHTL